MTGVELLVDALEGAGRPVVRHGREFATRCIGHDDDQPSFEFRAGDDGRVIGICRAGCGAPLTRQLEGLPLSREQLDAILGGSPNGRPTKPAKTIVATFDYVDEHGALLYQAVRYEPKGFSLRHKGPGGWVWNIKGIRLVPYQLPEVRGAVKLGESVYIAEGEKCVEAVRALGLVATCNHGGGEKWYDEHSASLVGATRVFVLEDNDDKGQKHGAAVVESLTRAGLTDVRRVTFPDLPPKGDVVDWLAALGAMDPAEKRRRLEAYCDEAGGKGILSMVERIGRVAPLLLSEVVATFRRWLYLPDAEPLYAVLATIAANLALSGDPVWVLLVAPSGRGKTELVDSVRTVPGVYSSATITESGLLSGSSKKDRAKDATGGLLRRIGERGVLLTKDFSSVLTMHRDARATVLSALREIYDGNWTRHLGADGGRSHHWEGHCGFLGGSTPVIDQYHAVMQALGERFLLVRLDEGPTVKQVRRALEHAGGEQEMRRELQAAAAGLLSSVRTDLEVGTAIDEDETDRLVSIAEYIALIRSPVIRDTYHTREIEQVSGTEGPGRLAKSLLQLFRGLVLIGLERPEAWRVVFRAGLDSAPPIRRRAMDIIDHALGGFESTPAIAATLGLPTITTRRALEDLHAYHLLERTLKGEGNADTWRLSERAMELRKVVPEKSEVYGGEDAREDAREGVSL